MVVPLSVPPLSMAPALLLLPRLLLQPDSQIARTGPLVAGARNPKNASLPRALPHPTHPKELASSFWMSPRSGRVREDHRISRRRGHE